jgi:RNA polymerase sigma-70 factor (ECF subfamily)
VPELALQADETLAAAAARGDAAAFDILVRRHERVVRGFLARLAPGGGRSDDLAQETFLTAWSKAASFAGAGRYRGWLMRIAWSTFLMDVRQRGRRLPQYSGSGEIPEQADGADAERDLIVALPGARPFAPRGGRDTGHAARDAEDPGRSREREAARPAGRRR